MKENKFLDDCITKIKKSIDNKKGYLEASGLRLGEGMETKVIVKVSDSGWISVWCTFNHFFNYEYQYLEEEVGRLSYSVEEWFDEKYSEFLDSYRPLRDVYINNSEAFVSEADVAGDMDVLNEIESKANELGLDVSEVYPDFEEHKRTIEYLEDLEKRFEDQKRELSNWIN